MNFLSTSTKIEAQLKKWNLISLVTAIGLLGYWAIDFIGYNNGPLPVSNFRTNGKRLAPANGADCLMSFNNGSPLFFCDNKPRA